MYSYNKYPFFFCFLFSKRKGNRQTLVQVTILPSVVLFSPFGYIQSTLVLFSPFCPLWSYSIYYGSIRSTLVLFDPNWSYSVHFGPVQSTLVLFSPFAYIWSILSTLVLFGPLLFPFSPMWSNSILFCSLLFHLVLFYPLLGFLYFLLLFSRNTNRTKKFMEREVARAKVGGIYIMTYIYIQTHLVI